MIAYVQIVKSYIDEKSSVIVKARYVILQEKDGRYNKLNIFKIKEMLR